MSDVNVTPFRCTWLMRDAAVEVALRALVEKQHGVVTGSQARRLGATWKVMQQAVATGSYERLTGRVLRLAGSVRTPHQRFVAAVLDAGPGAVLSHEAAAQLWELPGFRAGVPVVSRPRGGTRRVSPLAVIRQTCHLPRHHVTELFGVPVTTVARTLFDLAGRLHAGRLERAIDNAIARRLVVPAAIRSVVDEMAAHGRRGSTVMRQLMAVRPESYIPPTTGLEQRYLSILRRAGVPLPVLQKNLGGDEWAGRVDFVFDWLRLVMEIDSHLHHWSKLDRENDAARDERLRAAGLEVVHVDEDLVWHRPEEALAATLAAMTDQAARFGVPMSPAMAISARGNEGGAGGGASAARGNDGGAGGGG